MRVYLDNASTTPVDPLVLEAMMPYLNTYFGNPSSIHFHGRKAKAALEEARTKVARTLNASTGEIFFTSSATEANNMILLSSIRDLGIKRIISSPIEHHCILHTLEHIQSRNMAEVIFLHPDGQGNIDPAELIAQLKNSSIKTLTSLMHVNNEIGTVADINELSAVCREYDALFHSDTVQSVGKFPLNLSESHLNYCSGSAHKFFGPKGAGFLYMQMDFPFQSMLHGGSQERNMRAGTENVYGIIGLAKALELSHEQMKSRKEKITDLRVRFKAGLKKLFTDIQFHGNQEKNFHYGILNISLKRDELTEMLIMNLDIAGISASTGSACSSGVEHDSHVLQSIGVPADRKAIRFSFSHLNTTEEIDFTLTQITNIVRDKQADS